mmetsp:Transcript_11736/g.25048  ORF Transcript_11736/g.25048 Transcript_11736/m.25048 type:complete len:201 (+) Transcript_11736:613-1215(+)
MSLECVGCGCKVSVEHINRVLGEGGGLLHRARSLARQRQYADARAILDSLITRYEALPAGGESPTTERLLHPRHVLLFTSHATLINCTNALDDYYAAVKSSRVVVSCLELCGLAPSTETADFSDTLGQAIDRLLASRKLPRKTAQQLREEMAETLYRATHVRSVCMGPNHPATQHAMATLESLCPRHPLVEKARDLLVGE